MARTEYGGVHMQEAHLTWRVYLLGPFRLEVDGRSIPTESWRSRQAVSLFKRLVASAGASLSREALLEYLWPNESPEKGLRRLHTTVYNLRKALQECSGQNGTLLVRHASGRYRFEPPQGCWYDILTFENQFNEAVAVEYEQPDLALRLFVKAIDLYNGDFLSEDEYEEWTHHQREQYREMYIQALLKAASLYAKKRDLMAAVRLCRKGIEADPYREDVQYKYLEYLIAAKRIHEAERHFRKFTEMLRTELDSEPSFDLQPLLAQARATDPPEEQSTDRNTSTLLVFHGDTFETVLDLEARRRQRSGRRLNLLNLISSNTLSQAARDDLPDD